jgi:hypothetical protein
MHNREMQQAMKVLKFIPMFAIVLILYNIVAFATETIANQTVLFSLPFGGENGMPFTMNELLIFIGVLCLYLEIFKSTATSDSAIVEHVLSIAVFIIFIIELIMVEKAATTTFLILAMMSMLDVVGGMTITLKSARRDMSVAH